MEFLEYKAYSLINYLSDHTSHKCGYCGSLDSNYSCGVWAYQMTCKDYEDLIGMGWRRSGKYVYRPTMKMMCCPCYSLRCDALKHKLTNSQKKILKRVLRYLKTGEGKNTSTADESGESVEKSESTSTEAGKTTDDTTTSPMDTVESASSSEGTRVTEEEKEKRSESPMEESSESQPPKKQKKQPKPGLGIDSSKPPRKKAKQLRKERKQAKLSQKQTATDDSMSSDTVPGDKNSAKAQESKTLPDYINEILTPGPDWKHKLEISYVRINPKGTDYNDTLDESYEVYKKYQMGIHKEPEKECNKRDYVRFLAESPMTELYPEDGPPCGLGSFHMHYRLDGKLIGVAVLDLLPKSVSSVYFFYDPAYSFLRLGTFSVLREIAMVYEFNKKCKDIEYYYLGYYIHNCPKMRYKGQFQPLYVLCPEAFTWQPFENAVIKFEKSAYTRLDDSDKAPAPPECATVQMLYSGRIMKYSEFQVLSRTGRYYTREMTEYAEFAGQEVADRMLLMI